MPGCNAKITVYVPTRFSHKAVETRCGSTGYYGDPNFCEECEPKYAHRNWQQEAEENGEQWGDDY